MLQALRTPPSSTGKGRLEAVIKHLLKLSAADRQIKVNKTQVPYVGESHQVFPRQYR
jgi:hypothetical protein